MAAVEHASRTMAAGRGDGLVRVLITGKSCSGKTAFAKAQEGGIPVVSLDQWTTFKQVLECVRSNDRALFEGIPIGDEQQLPELLDEMDHIFVVDCPWVDRVERMLRRDGPSGFARFLYNDYFWETHVAPKLKSYDVAVVEG